jgi:hypothetical protein
MDSRFRRKEDLLKPIIELLERGERPKSCGSGYDRKPVLDDLQDRDGATGGNAGRTKL